MTDLRGDDDLDAAPSVADDAAPDAVSSALHDAAPEVVPAPRSLHTPIRWAVAVGTVLVVAAAVAITFAASHNAFDTAIRSLDRGAETVRTTTAQLQLVLDEARSDTLTPAADILAQAANDLVDPAARGAVSAAVADLQGVVTGGEDAVGATLAPPPAVTPVWPWELVGSAAEMNRRTRTVPAIEKKLGGIEDALKAGESTVDDAGTAMFASVTTFAPVLEAANVSARTADVVAFRTGADVAARYDDVSAAAATAFATYATAAGQVKVSNQQELAEKAGPLFDTRLAVEAYARSISGGVLLDFDWAPIVIGFGEGGSMAGTATWDSDDGGTSTITLTNSVAELWPSADSQALVTHEVGHSISSKCYEKFDWQNQSENEAWATAWAISMGQTSDANGVQAYGYPPQSLIDIAATCR